jgi:predicted signal transduction protein with EAL and GGDEF domain
MPETDSISAYAYAEQMRRVIRRVPFHGGRRVSVSAGICDLSEAGDAEELTRLADAALYWAKANGRDCCFVYSANVVRELSGLQRAERLARSQTLAGILALARPVDAKDQGTHEHSERVAEFAARRAQARRRPVERGAMIRVRTGGTAKADERTAASVAPRCAAGVASVQRKERRREARRAARR